MEIEEKLFGKIKSIEYLDYKVTYADGRRIDSLQGHTLTRFENNRINSITTFLAYFRYEEGRNRVYSYDEHGNIFRIVTFKVDNNEEIETKSYLYDEKNRLIMVEEFNNEKQSKKVDYRLNYINDNEILKESYIGNDIYQLIYSININKKFTRIITKEFVYDYTDDRTKVVENTEEICVDVIERDEILVESFSNGGRIEYDKKNGNELAYYSNDDSLSRSNSYLFDEQGNWVRKETRERGVFPIYIYKREIEYF